MNRLARFALHVLCVLGLLTLVFAAASAPWTMARGDCRNTARVQVSGPENWTPAWTQKVGPDYTELTNGVVGADGTMYAYSAGTQLLYAFNPDGSIAWSVHALTGVDWAPAISQDGTWLVYAQRDGSLAQISLKNKGEFMGWIQLSYGPFMTSAPRIGPTGNIYSGSQASWNATLGVVDPTLKRLNYYITYAAHGDPAIGDDGTVYLVEYDQEKQLVYAVHGVGSEGGDVWSYGHVMQKPLMSGTPVAPILADNGYLLVGAGTGVMALKTSLPAALAWQTSYNTTLGVIQLMALDWQGNLVLLTSQYYLLSLRIDTGAVNWQLHLSNTDQWLFAPYILLVDGENRILSAGRDDRNNNLFWVDAKTGEVLSRSTLASDGSTKPDNTPAVGPKGELYLQNYNALTAIPH